MLEASELRIGNWVMSYQDKEPVAVTPKMILEQYQCDLVGRKHLRGINITSEWLRDFGFNDFMSRYK